MHITTCIKPHEGNFKMNSQKWSRIVSPLGHPLQNFPWNECSTHIVCSIKKEKHATAAVLCNRSNGWAVVPLWCRRNENIALQATANTPRLKMEFARLLSCCLNRRQLWNCYLKKWCICLNINSSVVHRTWMHMHGKCPTENEFCYLVTCWVLLELE